MRPNPPNLRDRRNRAAHRTLLAPSCWAVVLLACSASGPSGGSSAAGGVAGLGIGGTSTGGASTSSGGTSSGGTSSGGTTTSSAGTNTGGASSGGTNTAGANTGGENIGGTSSGGTSSGGTSSGGTSSGGTGGTLACTNPAYTLPLNPTNPQDGVTLGGFYVDTDTWNAANYQVSQTMYICDYDNWYVVANMNNQSGDGAVKTYPNVHKDFNSAPKISSFNTITSSFAHTGPHVGIYEFAYDIWLNGVASSGSTEVMIWTDNYNQVPSGSVQETVMFDSRTYNVYKSGSYIAFVDGANVTSGTVNLLTFFNHIIAKGWIPATSTVGAIDYGVELVSTNGKDATFQVNGFSLTTN